jgi:glycosyltransferase involved in cell wall biosynthesis
MKLAIIGTAGIPSNYGGFETLAEYLTKELNSRLSITVYCSSKSYESKVAKHNGAKLIYIPLNANGIQSILYDIISLFHAAKSHNTILILGVSGCIILPLFRFFYPKKKLIVNIDGLEHKREKWKKPIQKFLKFSEKLAVKYADIVITDNKAIQDYVTTEYKKQSVLIAYGGNHSSKAELSSSVIEKYKLPENYAFKVCRIEPENNIQLILEAFSLTEFPIVIVGNWNYSEYGKNLKNQYSVYNHMFLLDAIYDQVILNQIRSNCKIYIHGHSAGGTNPSLVEAMYLGLPTFAYDVEYNRATTKNKARYFKSKFDLTELVTSVNSEELMKIGNEMNDIAKRDYTWEVITKKYYDIITT